MVANEKAECLREGQQHGKFSISTIVYAHTQEIEVQHLPLCCEAF